MIPKEAIEAACAVLNERDKGNVINIPNVVAMLTAALAAIPAPAVRVEYANRSTGGFAPAPDLAAEARIAELEAAIKARENGLRVQVENHKRALHRIAELEREKHAALTMIAMLEKQLAGKE